MKEKDLRQQIQTLKDLFNNLQVLTMTGLQEIESLEEKLPKEKEEPTEILLDEIIDNEVENMVNEITRRLDKVYGSKKVVVNVKEVK